MLQEEFKLQGENQKQRLAERNNVIIELQANMNKLGKYKDNLRNVSLRHLITIMVLSCRRLMETNFKTFKEVTDKIIPDTINQKDLESARKYYSTS